MLRIPSQAHCSQAKAKQYIRARNALKSVDYPRVTATTLTKQWKYSQIVYMKMKEKKVCLLFILSSKYKVTHRVRAQTTCRYSFQPLVQDNNYCYYHAHHSQAIIVNRLLSLSLSSPLSNRSSNESARICMTIIIQNTDWCCTLYWHHLIFTINNGKHNCL